MKTWKKIGIGAAIFGAGMVAGIAADRCDKSRRAIDKTIDGSKRMFSSLTNKNESREQSSDNNRDNNDRRDNNHNDRRN